MLWPQYGYTCISSGKLKLVLQLMANKLNIFYETVYNFLDNFILTQLTQYVLGEQTGRSTEYTEWPNKSENTFIEPLCRCRHLERRANIN